ncbi:MAG: DUF3048 C-terminal domain-containing protein [Anaerolineales bacterium]|nr:DUF3048 C-terminal domain-containing protein [Anaerolineales bacterium]
MKKLAILMVLLWLLTACLPANQGRVPAAPAVETPSDNYQEAGQPVEEAPAADSPAEQALAAEAEDPEPGAAEAATTPTDTPHVIQQDGSLAVSNSQSQSELPGEESNPLPNPIAASGPDAFPAGTNPLTGLPAVDPELLALPPALVSVTNFPVSSRPPAGLSFAPLVFELYIGEGMTRFLALFYGEYPSLTPQVSSDASVTTDNQPEIGPVRSGRLPYQAIRQLYNGFLVMASASPDVKEDTTDFTNIYGSDKDDINSAFIDVTRLHSIAEANRNALGANLTGNAFDPQPPAGGQKAESLWSFYKSNNQVQWGYDPASSKYLRYQDRADGTGEFYPSTDRLTGEQLASDNVIVLFVKHNVLNSDRTLIDIDLLYSKGQAYLLRDGQLYPVLWTTLGGEYEKSTGLLRPIRFIDSNGNPIPLKPGNTWVEIVDVSTDFQEVEPGGWKARFYSP